MARRARRAARRRWPGCRSPPVSIPAESRASIAPQQRRQPLAGQRRDGDRARAAPREPRATPPSRSALFSTSIAAALASPHPARASAPAMLVQHARARRRAAPRLSGWATSRTCRMTSAAATSSSVARKAATSCGRQVGDEADGVGQDRPSPGRQADGRAWSGRAWRTAGPAA